MGAEQRHEGAELVPAGLEFTPFVEARGDLADVVKGGDLSLNLSRFAFQSASKAGTVVEKLSLNDAGMPLPYKVLITGTPSAKLVSVPLPQ